MSSESSSNSSESEDSSSKVEAKTEFDALVPVIGQSFEQMMRKVVTRLAEKEQTTVLKRGENFEAIFNMIEVRLLTVYLSDYSYEVKQGSN